MGKQKGLTLVELIVAVSVIGFLALMVSIIPSSISSINRSRHISIARDVASKELDYYRRLGYVNLNDGTYPFTDVSLNTLPDVSATAVITDCPYEICGLGDEIQNKPKEVKVIISWKESDRTESVKLTTIISEGGIGQ